MRQALGGLLLGTTVLVAACSSQDATPSAQPGTGSPATASPSATATAPVPSASATTTATVPSASATPAPAPTDPTPYGALVVEAFADVVADAVVMRAGPGLDSRVYVQAEAGDYPPGHSFPPMAVGTTTHWPLVYVLDGPVRADGYEWYLVATSPAAHDGYYEASDVATIGWVAAGDERDAWLIPSDMACPAPPIRLADVTNTAISRLAAIYCFGGQNLTLRGFYTDPPPGEPLEGDCPGEPDWLVCTWGGHLLRPKEGTWAGDGNALELHFLPNMGPLPQRPGWIEVTGQFDHRAAGRCGDGEPASQLGCRMAFVVTSARAAE